MPGVSGSKESRPLLSGSDRIRFGRCVGCGGPQWLLKAQAPLIGCRIMRNLP
jgi:hypothetical protein